MIKLFIVGYNCHNLQKALLYYSNLGPVSQAVYYTFIISLSFNISNVQLSSMRGYPTTSLLNGLFVNMRVNNVMTLFHLCFASAHLCQTLVISQDPSVIFSSPLNQSIRAPAQSNDPVASHQRVRCEFKTRFLFSCKRKLFTAKFPPTIISEYFFCCFVHVHFIHSNILVRDSFFHLIYFYFRHRNFCFSVFVYLSYDV